MALIISFIKDYYKKKYQTPETATKSIELGVLENKPFWRVKLAFLPSTKFRNLVPEIDECIYYVIDSGPPDSIRPPEIQLKLEGLSFELWNKLKIPTPKIEGYEQEYAKTWYIYLRELRRFAQAGDIKGARNSTHTTLKRQTKISNPSQIFRLPRNAPPQKCYWRHQYQLPPLDECPLHLSDSQNCHPL